MTVGTNQYDRDFADKQKRVEWHIDVMAETPGALQIAASCATTLVGKALMLLGEPDSPLPSADEPEKGTINTNADFYADTLVWFTRDGDTATLVVCITQRERNDDEPTAEDMALMGVRTEGGMQ